MVQRALSVGWAPLAVVATHAILSRAIGHHREFDPWFHFLGGAAGAHALLRAFTAFPAMLRPIAKWPRGWTVLLLVTGAVLLWELGEFANDRLFGTHVQQGTLDTGSDIVLGIAGALAVVRVAGIVRRREVGASAIGDSHKRVG